MNELTAFVLLALLATGLWAADRAGKRILAEREAHDCDVIPCAQEPAATGRRLTVGGTGEEVELDAR